MGRMSKMKNKDVDNHVAEVVQTMPHSGIRKFFDLIEKTDGVISLGVGEPDYITPEVIREACMKALVAVYHPNHPSYKKVNY
jgi:aminotransferase